MTQFSYPWPGKAPANGPDAGRYRANQWWAVWASILRAGGIVVPAAVNPLRTDTALADIGVIYAIPERLEVTDAGGFVAEVDLGGALVDGQFYYNDATVSLTMPASQTYYVVLRKNFTAASYTPPGYVAGDGVVPAYTTRITWVSALVQSTDRTTYWDTPLATVVTDGAEITSVTDTRKYVDAETKRRFIQAGVGASTTIGYTDEVLKFYDAHFIGRAAPFIELNHTDTSAIMIARIAIPEDFISGMTMEGVILSANSGDIVCWCAYQAAACSEAYNTHSGFSAPGVETISADDYACLAQLDVADVSLGDFVWLKFERNGPDGSDTINASINGLGFVIEYLGWK